MNEKKLFLAVFIVAVIIGFVLAAFLSGCGTRPVVVATDESVISSQVSAARIKAVNDGLRDILQVYDEQIAGQIGYSIRGIDDAIAALDRYDEFVQGLIKQIRELERTTRAGEGESQDAE